MISRGEIITGLVAQFGCATHGFREALRVIVEDYVSRTYEDDDPKDPEDPEDQLTPEELAEHLFEDWFGYGGKPNVIPPAFRIDLDKEEPEERGIWRYHIHVWEIENAPLAPHKIRNYGAIADNDGPCITLHVIDRYGREIAVLDTADLTVFCPCTTDYEEVGKRFRELMARERSDAAVTNRAINSVLVGQSGSLSLEKFVPASILAKRLGVPTLVLKGLAEKGVLPPAYGLGGNHVWHKHVYYAESDVEQWLVKIRERGDVSERAAAYRGHERDSRRNQQKRKSAQERAILRAVYELGLIKPGDEL